MRYGSDVMIDWLVELGIRHVAINPGATIRGLHESLVRDDRVSSILALHEETAVGIAHGYWKATGSPMAVFLHDMVGLQHASMALFNATLDRAPMLVLGGSGPRDEASRRPWLDWIHSSTRHSAAVQDVVKATAEPGSQLGVRDAMARGLSLALSSPEGPVYIGVDTGDQEGPLADAVSGAGVSALPSFTARAPVEQVDRVAELLSSARYPVIVVDRPAAGGTGSLVRLVERIGVPVIDLGGGFSFPSRHWADQTESRRRHLAAADLVLAVEVRDVAWALSDVETGTRARTYIPPTDATVIAVGCSPLLNIPGIVVDQLLPGVIQVVGDAGLFLDDLAGNVSDDAPTLAERRAALVTDHDQARAESLAQALAHAHDTPIHPGHLSVELGRVLGDSPWLLANGIVKDWPRRLWSFGPDNRFLGRSGGEGLGYGFPAALGAALAHRDDDRLVANLQSDGDMMYTASALWTAAHHQLPLLTVMYNNGSYGKDELHQRELATLRGRSLDTTHIGIRLDSPRIDFASLASSQGVEGIGPVSDPAQLSPALDRAARIVREERRPVLVDVRCM